MFLNFKKQKRRFVRAYYRWRTKRAWEAKNIPCPLCGNYRDFTTLWDKDRYGLPIKTVRCDTCSLVFTRPFPTDKFLNEFYSSRMFRGLDWGVMRVTRVIAQEFGAASRATKHINFLLDLLKRGIIEQSKFSSILDIGSSEGSFLIECKKLFPTLELYGVEPGKNFRFLNEHCFRQVFADLNNVPKSQTFDCITMWHVLEHVSDPVLMLSQIRNHMSSSSVLIFEVPDVSRYDSIRPIHVDHTFHYNKETLQKILEKAGLQLTESSQDASVLMDEKYGIKIVAKSV